MNKGQSIVLRVAGIVFFMLTIATSLEMLSRAVGSWVFMIEGESSAWGVFYVLTSMLFTSFFVFAAFASGLASIFAGKEPYTQAIWNCSSYALTFVSVFALLQILTGITEDDASIVLVSSASILGLIVFMVITFFCLRKEETFYWKNLYTLDVGTKLCFKVWGIMLVVIYVGTFIYAHKLLDA